MNVGEAYAYGFCKIQLELLHVGRDWHLPKIIYLYHLPSK
jgi:hypothetical protein